MKKLLKTDIEFFFEIFVPSQKTPLGIFQKLIFTKVNCFIYLYQFLEQNQSEKMYRMRGGEEGGYEHFFFVKCVEERKTTNFCETFLKKLSKGFFKGIESFKIIKSIFRFFVHKVFVPPSSTSSTKKI